MKTLMTDGSLALVLDSSGEAWVLDLDTGAQSAALTADEVEGLERELIEMSSVELTPAAVEVLSVDAEAADADEGQSFWVTATVNGLTVRIFAAPHADGRPGLEPCGDSLDDWCPVELRTAFGDKAADRLGREAILMARL